MKTYLAHDAINGEYEEFETIEDARKWLEESFLDYDQGYYPETESCRIFELKEKVILNVVDSKKNYKYLDEDDIPDDDNESEAWPYDSAFDEICKHEFVSEKVKQTPFFPKY